MSAVFAYGTLQVPEVMLSVTGRVFPVQPARLDNFVRRKLRGTHFPGIRPKSGASVRGLYIGGLDSNTLAKLDDFESDYYRRERHTVLCLKGVAREAETYVLREEYHHLLLGEDWRLSEFRVRQLPGFLARPF